MEASEDLASRLARVEHLLSRNSSSAPSKDDEPGQAGAADDAEPRRWRAETQAGQAVRGAGFSPGLNRHPPTRRPDRFPHGHYECGNDLAAATDLGVVDRCQQHEIPQVTIRVNPVRGALRVRPGMSSN